MVILLNYQITTVEPATPMRAIPVARIFFCSRFPITHIIVALTPDARMFSQLHILTIETSQNIL